MVTTLVPTFHDAGSPLLTVSPSTSIDTVSLALVGVALITLVALVVVAEYANTPLSKVGVSVNEPIVSLLNDGFDIRGLLA